MAVAMAKGAAAVMGVPKGSLHQYTAMMTVEPWIEAVLAVELAAVSVVAGDGGGEGGGG